MTVAGAYMKSDWPGLRVIRENMLLDVTLQTLARVARTSDRSRTDCA
jgi:hypothetical protein